MLSITGYHPKAPPCIHQTSCRNTIRRAGIQSEIPHFPAQLVSTLYPHVGLPDFFKQSLASSSSSASLAPSITPLVDASQRLNTQQTVAEDASKKQQQAATPQTSSPQQYQQQENHDWDHQHHHQLQQQENSFLGGNLQQPQQLQESKTQQQQQNASGLPSPSDSFIQRWPRLKTAAAVTTGRLLLEETLVSSIHAPVGISHHQQQQQPQQQEPFQVVGSAQWRDEGGLCLERSSSSWRAAPLPEIRMGSKAGDFPEQQPEQQQHPSDAQHGVLQQPQPPPQQLIPQMSEAAAEGGVTGMRNALAEDAPAAAAGEVVSADAGGLQETEAPQGPAIAAAAASGVVVPVKDPGTLDLQELGISTENPFTGTTEQLSALITAATTAATRAVALALAERGPASSRRSRKKAAADHAAAAADEEAAAASRAAVLEYRPSRYQDQQQEQQQVGQWGSGGQRSLKEQKPSIGLGNVSGGVGARGADPGSGQEPWEQQQEGQAAAIMSNLPNPMAGQQRAKSLPPSLNLRKSRNQQQQEQQQQGPQQEQQQSQQELLNRGSPQGEVLGGVEPVGGQVQQQRHRQGQGPVPLETSGQPLVDWHEGITKPQQHQQHQPLQQQQQPKLQQQHQQQQSHQEQQQQNPHHEHHQQQKPHQWHDQQQYQQHQPDRQEQHQQVAASRVEAVSLPEDMQQSVHRTLHYLQNPSGATMVQGGWLQMLGRQQEARAAALR